jgi:hypothetical protein
MFTLIEKPEKLLRLREKRLADEAMERPDHSDRPWEQDGVSRRSDLLVSDPSIQQHRITELMGQVAASAGLRDDVLQIRELTKVWSRSK